MNRLIAFVLICLCALSGAKAELVVDINKGTFQPLPIAITNFGEGKSGDLVGVGRDITSVITNDLIGSGLFKLVDPFAYIQTGADAMKAPRFADWRILNSEALLSGTVIDEGNLVRVEFRLFDVLAENQLEGLSLVTDKKNWRKMAHKIADIVYERLTGDKGYFNTRIVYVAHKGGQRKPVERLAVMDYDGANHKFLTSGGNLVMTPRFSPNGEKVAYLDFGPKNKESSIRVFDMKTGKTTGVAGVKGLKISPRFSPDGQTMLMSIADHGTTSLYELDLKSGGATPQRLTKSSGSIDVTPCYAPDGQRIVYTSDRSGSPNLYVKGRGPGEGERISFGGGSYNTPVWSPRGDLIAFTRKAGGVFYVGVMRPDGKGERMLTKGYLVEGPEWSPNGRRIIFTRQDRAGGSTQVYSVDITGNNEARADTPGEASYASWSPLIQD